MIHAMPVEVERSEGLFDRGFLIVLMLEKQVASIEALHCGKGLLMRGLTIWVVCYAFWKFHDQYLLV